MKLLTVFICLCTSLQLMAAHSLGAHEHGAVKLTLAIEANRLDVDLDSPAESLLGFEYLPQTANEKEIFNNVKMLWEKKLLSLMTFDHNIICMVSYTNLSQTIDKANEQTNNLKKSSGVHGDIEASAKITCDKKIEGNELKISLIKNFKKIKKIKVEVLGTKTMSMEIRKEVDTIKL